MLSYLAVNIHNSHLVHAMTFQTQHNPGTLDLLKLHSIFILIVNSLIARFRLIRHAHSRSCMKNNLFPREQCIDILERQISGFRVEEVYQRKKEEVEYTEIDVRLVANAVDADGRDFDDQKGEDPIGGRGQGGSTRTDCERSVFGRYCILK